MTPIKVPIREQIVAMELEIANTRGHLANIRKLAGQNKYDPTMVKIVEAHLPRLEAVKKSLEFLEKYQDKIRKAISG